MPLRIAASKFGPALGHPRCDTTRSLVYVFVFPDDLEDPTGFAQPFLGVFVPSHIPADFLSPVRAICGRCTVVRRAPVPEATAKLDGDPRWSEDHIDGPAHVG